MIRSEFDKSKTLSADSPSDAIQIETLKANAVRALSNYMLYEGGIQDRGKGGKLGMAMDSFHKRSLDGMARSSNLKEQNEDQSRRRNDDVNDKKS
jgi:hypothetical protein